MELQTFVNQFAAQFDNTDPNEISAKTKFQELDEWDSITTVVIIGFVQTEYGKNITGAEIRNCESVNDLFEFIKSK